MTKEDLAIRFSYHSPGPQQAPRFPNIRAAMFDAAYTVDLNCPEGREKSLALTKLEEAMFWANAAIVREA